MNKITIDEDSNKRKIVRMYDMPVGSIGRVIGNTTYKNSIVRRSFSSEVVLIEILSDPGVDKCWANEVTALDVELLPDAEIKVII